MLLLSAVLAPFSVRSAAAQTAAAATDAGAGPVSPSPAVGEQAPAETRPQEGSQPSNGAADEAARLAAGAPGQPSGPTVMLPTPGSTHPAPNPEPVAAANQLTVGEGGGLKVSGLLQVWGVNQHQRDISDPGNDASTLRLRRAELKVSGDIVPKRFSFGVMIDPAKTPRFGNATVVTPPEGGSTETGTASVLTAAPDNSILQDAAVTYHTPWFEISAGQFKTPLAYESQTSSGKLLFPERAAVVRAYGEQRDPGVKIAHKSEYIGIVLGAFNGAGINRVDNNMQKDLVLRVEGYPLKGVTIGAVGYTSVGQRATQASTKDRVEGDLSIQLGDLLLQGEYIRAWDGPQGARTEGHGWYGVVGYTLAKLVQPLVRVGQLDRNLDVAGDAVTTIEVGLNYFVVKDSVKLQAAIGHSRFQSEGVGALNEAIVAGQYRF